MELLGLMGIVAAVLGGIILWVLALVACGAAVASGMENDEPLLTCFGIVGGIFIISILIAVIITAIQTALLGG